MKTLLNRVDGKACLRGRRPEPARGWRETQPRSDSQPATAVLLGVSFRPVGPPLSGPCRRFRCGNWIYGILFTLIALASFLDARAAPRLNIICIVTDDQSQWSVGVYGNRDARTPNMNRLAREGALFQNAFVATPVCSPSRAAFLTGRYGTQVGITDYISLKEGKAGVGLAPESTTWPRVLQRNGYVTGLIGKWHLGDLPQFHPARLGFDYFYGARRGSFKPKDPELEVDGKEVTVPGFSADVVMDAALGFIATNASRPFALLVHFREPHLPYDPVAEADSAPFRDLNPSIPHFDGLDAEQVKKWHREYYAAIHAVDRNIGRLLQRLDELQLAGRTIVMFTSDNGYMIGQHGLYLKGNGQWILGGKRGPARPNMFDESILVPLIIRWPGVAKPGITIPQPVSNIDTYATVLGMLGIAAPAGWKHEGVDFSPLLRGKKFTPHDAIFGQYDLHNEARANMRMIRTREWKLIRHHFTNSFDELYNLKNDPGETNNLYGVASARRSRERLQSTLTRWQESIDDPILHATADGERSSR